MAGYYILMADIISSRSQKGSQLIETFREVIDDINRTNKNRLLSPLTITLGDEFQGITNSIQAAVAIIIQIEEKLINKGAGFKLRYVLHYGEIDTPINHEIAYEMLGKGLTDAREKLNELKNNKEERVVLDVEHQNICKTLNKAFLIFSHIVDKWKLEDYPLISAFLKDKDYKAVANELSRDRPSTWRRQKTLRVAEYYAIKDIIIYLSNEQ